MTCSWSYLESGIGISYDDLSWNEVTQYFEPASYFSSLNISQSPEGNGKINFETNQNQHRLYLVRIADYLTIDRAAPADKLNIQPVSSGNTEIVLKLYIEQFSPLRLSWSPLVVYQDGQNKLNQYQPVNDKQVERTAIVHLPEHNRGRQYCFESGMDVSCSPVVLCRYSQIAITYSDQFGVMVDGYAPGLIVAMPKYGGGPGWDEIRYDRNSATLFPSWFFKHLETGRRIANQLSNASLSFPIHYPEQEIFLLRSYDSIAPFIFANLTFGMTLKRSGQKVYADGVMTDSLYKVRVRNTNPRTLEWEILYLCGKPYIDLRNTSTKTFSCFPDTVYEQAEKLFSGAPGLPPGENVLLMVILLETLLTIGS